MSETSDWNPTNLLFVGLSVLGQTCDLAHDLEISQGRIFSDVTYISGNGQVLGTTDWLFPRPHMGVKSSIPHLRSMKTVARMRPL